MKPTKYIENGKVITVTEWAKGMKNVLAVVIEADGSEGLRTADQLKKLDKVEDTPRKPAASGRPKRKRRPPERHDRWVECAGHMAAGTDPVTACVVSGVLDRKPRKPAKIDWGKTFEQDEQVPVGVAVGWAACTAAILWISCKALGLI